MATAAQAYTMLGNEMLWQAARQVHAALEKGVIAHAVLVDVAVCLHGYQRNTVDIDLLIRRDDANRIRRILAGSGFEWRSGSLISPVPAACQYSY